jgi:hypothetical protein
MNDADPYYDFEAGMLRELHAAQARLDARDLARPPARRRMPGRPVLAAGAAVLAAAGVSAGLGVVTPHAPSGTAPAATTAAFATAKLSGSLRSAARYMITSHVTQPATGERLTTWLDPATGSRRMLLASAAGARETGIGVVLRGTTATITTVNYGTGTVTRQTEPAAVIQNSARLGVNAPSPAQIRSELRSATLVSQGQVTIDGQRAYRIRMVVPPPSQIWFPGDVVDLYVRASSYQLIRVTIRHNGTLTDTDNLTWTPRRTADLSLTRLAVPAGFRKS